MVKWFRNNKMVSDATPRSESYGFIYEITYSNGQRYIGKKSFWSITKKHFTKKRIKELTDSGAYNKRMKQYDTITKESGWRQYNGSTALAKGLVIVDKRILEICKDKINLTYCEVKHMVTNNVLTEDRYLNSNILGKFYSGKIKEGK